MENHEFEQDVNTLIARRFEELEEIKKMNVRPYEYSYDVDTYSKQIKINLKITKVKP